MRTIKIAVFAAISAAAHVALLALPIGAQRADTPPQSPFNVSLITRSPAAPDAGVSRRKSHPLIRHRSTTQTRALAPTALANKGGEIQSSASTEVQAPPVSFEPPSPANTRENNSVVDPVTPVSTRTSLAPYHNDMNFALVLSYLRDTIERSKAYPLLAQQRGWEGEVLLAFRVVDDGAIQSVHVARSSGNPLLDRSAVTALQNVERVIPSLWRNGDHAELELSVIYRLIKI